MPRLGQRVSSTCLSAPYECLRLLRQRNQQNLQVTYSVCFLPHDLPDPFRTDAGRGPENFAESHRCVFGRVSATAKQCVGFVVDAKRYIALREIKT